MRLQSITTTASLGVLFLGGAVWANPPAHSQAGGIPACEAALDEATTSFALCSDELGTCTTDLATCEGDLATCQANQGGIPGDGQDNATFPLPPPSNHGPALAYQDCGDGTIADLVSGLLWEKQLAPTDPSCTDATEANRDVRCLNRGYSWTDPADGDYTNPDGTVFTEFLTTLNGSGFAGYSDWRLPTVRELYSIVDFSVFFIPIINAAFGPTGPGGYWSATTVNDQWFGAAWLVDFQLGETQESNKDGKSFTRAVRTGSCSEPS